MEIRKVLSEDRIIFNLNSETKEDIIKEMAKMFVDDGSVEKKDYDKLVEAIIEREKLSSTGLQDGIAIPHCKTSAIKKLSIAVAIVKEGKEFDSLDEKKTRMFFMIAGDKNCGQDHLKFLQLISKLTFDEDKLKKIKNTTNKKEVIDILASL